MSETIVIYHNPRCSKSRQVLALLVERGVEANVICYLDDPPSVATLDALIDKLGIEPHALLRSKENAYSDVGLTPDSSRSAIIAAIVDHPILLERPVIVRGERAVIGRPPARVLELL